MSLCDGRVTHNHQLLRGITKIQHQRHITNILILTLEIIFNVFQGGLNYNRQVHAWYDMIMKQRSWRKFKCINKDNYYLKCLFPIHNHLSCDFRGLFGRFFCLLLILLIHLLIWAGNLKSQRTTGLKWVFTVTKHNMKRTDMESSDPLGLLKKLEGSLESADLRQGW